MNEQEFNQMLAKYADVIVNIGLGLRKNQVLFINGILEDAPFAREVAKSAYKAGAKYVDLLLTDEPSARINYEYADPEHITYFPEWVFSRYEECFKNGDAFLSIASTNPDLLEGIDSDMISKRRKSSMEKFFPIRTKYDNNYNWCIASTATPLWAQKVFSGIPVQEAQTKLWEAIFKVCRVDQPDPVAAWTEHTDRLIKIKSYLNGKHYASLHYRAPGTNLIIGLPESHRWNAAKETYNNGTTGTPNIPTEEVFTSPHKDKIEGHVSSTMPLNLTGRLVEDFVVTFENGKAVNVTAKKGEDDIRKLIEMDEGASRLGEAALVAESSPIKQSGILFYNTLFDENASCHLAFGDAFKDSFKGGYDLTDEEFQAAGGNKSIIHTDFMIGSAEMDIDGITQSGDKEPIIRSGEWAFEA
jgi:aminopeptidase